jgi:uncharacterized protein (DUF1778 family)
MPALNVPFSDDELGALRAAAEQSEQSLRAFVHDAAVAAADAHKQRVASAARLVAERSAQLNQRLADL